MSAYLTLDQAAEFCSTPLATLRFWISTNKLPAFKPGRRVLVRQADLLELIEGSAVGEIRKTKAKLARKPAAKARCA
jgi:excisionase family DNA binding protein